MKEYINIVIAGEAGQGIETITDIITKVFKTSGYNVFSSKEYMSRVRGGVNTSQIRISQAEIFASCEKIDFLFALSKNSINHLQKNITEETFIIHEPSNVIAAGIIFGIFNIEIALIEEYLKKSFSDKTEDIILKNIEAVKIGYEIGKNTLVKNRITINIEKDKTVEEKILIDGTQAVSLGCIAGGCDFLSSYPMSPGTGVLTYLAQKSDDFNIIVEQAEDEIAAMNMSIGSWFVGARGMVTTSGGGFDLMTEGLSLAGITESPIVIHLAQRPGPATGCPTRTEQGDLNLAIYSGHGEFPRIVLAPGTCEDAFYLSQNAFNLADKYQVPVFILTDQYFLDSLALSEPFDVNNKKIQDFITQTNTNYKRYEFSDNGISPRGIPAYGDGLVKIDSDEHDEEGCITESFDIRTKMSDKRLKKLDLIKQEAYLPELYGNKNYKTLLIGWGSTSNVIKEALKVLNNPDTAFLYFKQVYPLPENTFSCLKKAQKIICIENNATGQFAGLIRQETEFSVHHKILKYNGLPFYVEELTDKIKDLI